MKSFDVIFVAALLAIPTATTSLAITIDGTLDSGYPPVIVVQDLGTGFGDNNVGTINAANGSELDAAYGMISNSTLFLFFAGNLEGGSNVYNKIEVFIDSVAGGQNVLSNNASAGADGALPRMSYDGTNPGLTFDSAFAADYWFGVVCGGGPPASLYLNYATLPTLGGGTSAYLGSEVPTNDAALGMGVHAAINDINIAGVSGGPGGGTGCVLNATSQHESNATYAVTTGVELAIPLSAIGSPAGSIEVCAFINGQSHDFVSTQVLGPLGNNDPSYCTNNPGEPRLVNFNNYPGQHYFVVNPIGCNYGVIPTSATMDQSGGSGSVNLSAAAGCPYASTSNVPWITITSGGSGVAPGTVNYSVTPNTTPVGRTGTISIGGQTFTLNQYGQPLAVLIDGAAETNHYTCAPLAIQLMGTSFGDNSQGQVDQGNGNELDAAYGVIENGVLYLVLAGNLSSDGTKLEVFFQTGPGGQNTLTNINPDVGIPSLNRLGAGTNNMGLTFDADFAANYWIGLNLNGSTLFANYAALWPATNGYFLGSTVGMTNGSLFGGTNPFGIQAAINDSNTVGVLDVSGICYTDPSTYNQGSINTGVELGIPLSALGNPTGAVKVCAFFSGISRDLIANQFLNPLWDGTGLYCASNLGDPTNGVNLSTQPSAAGPHYFMVGPEMRITGVSRSGNNINVSWLSASNSNLVYQLQSKSSITNATWNDIGSSTNGTGSITTQTDTGAAANPMMFYRVKQIPVCPP